MSTQKISTEGEQEGSNAKFRNNSLFYQKQNQNKMNNPIQWIEIAATDLERSKQFYSKVFGLEFQLIEMPDSKMYMFGAPNEKGSAGCLVTSPENKPSTDGSIVYFSCEDVSIEAGKVEQAGGKLIVPKTDIGEFGFFAQFIDTEGNRIGIHSQS